MHRQPLLTLLRQYNTNDLEENVYREKTIEFVENEVECFSRALLKGHITGSSLIVNQKLTKTVLVFHTKIKKWLQPGGHADGNPNVIAVALKEACEETGLKNLKVFSEILDIDVHTISARKDVPEHLHYDIRFLIFADEFEPFIMSDESTDIQWIRFEDVPKFNSENSLIRMLNKVQKNADLFV